MGTRLAIIEEHHEAFIVVHHAIRTGVLPPTGNCLLHVDHHSDLGIPIVRSSLDTIPGRELDSIAEFTYSELGIGSFIVPSIYLGVWRHVTWLDQTGPDDEGLAERWEPLTIISDEVLRGHHYVEAYIRSRGQSGRNLLVGQMNESLRQIDDPSRQEFSVQYLKLPATEHNLPDEPWVLDIDLDYFSCSGDPYLQHDIKLELTQREYHALQSPYHPFNLLKGRPKLITANGCFFAQFTQSDPEYSSCMTVSEDEIIRRVDNLVDFLNEQDIDPMFVIVCRSRHSGFTRADQWEFIECTLLERLNEAFEFDPAPFSKVGRPRCRALLGG